MKKITILILLTVFVITTAKSQTDPMITGWWFNTTGSKYKGILTDVDAVYYNTSNVYVKTSGVPDYYRDSVSVNNAKDLNAVWVLPRVPSPAVTPSGFTGGQSGLLYDCSVFFTPGDARSYMNAGVWNQLAYFFEINDMDPSNGHSTPNNMYHHHFDDLKLHSFDSTKHSPIVGFAWDGYPVYGPYGYKDTDGTGGIKRMVSSYSTKSYTIRASGPAVGGSYPIGCYIEDWQYVAGSGDLDAHNGRFCKTPEYPSGTYAYFTTVGADLKPVYPYFIGPTYYGTYSNINVGPSGGTTTVPTGTTKYNPPTYVNEIGTIESNIELFPIPVIDDLNIRLKENKTYVVVIYDLSGKVLDNRQINSTAKINMSYLPYGAYLVQVSDLSNKQGFVKRIVKQ